jgi:hypothetical protein
MKPKKLKKISSLKVFFKYYSKAVDLNTAK